MDIQIESFGKISDENVDLITVHNKSGMNISVTNYGCIVTAVRVKDRHGELDNVVLSYDSLDKYCAGHPFFGPVVGRFANRINNGEFFLNNKHYKLEQNETATSQHIHGGSKGFDKYIWDYAIEKQKDAIFIHFHRISIDGESGYPGNLDVMHTVGLDEENQLHFYYRATTDQPTIINLTNHSYYNLCGLGKGNILNQKLKVYSDFYLPVDKNLIPTGEILSVAKSGFDFRENSVIKENMQKIADKTIDNTFVLRSEPDAMGFKQGIELFDPQSGRLMKMSTTQPGVQIYNSSKLSNGTWIGDNGLHYASFDGICFETQHFPDSPNQLQFPTTILNPNEVYDERTIHQFSVVSQ